jgi:hypothetical protein
MASELQKFKKNIYSQVGEDGIIKEILKRLKKKINKTCVEFGAWDGIHYSNTYNLIKNYNFKAILIEGDKKKFKELCNNIPSKKVIKINKFVEFSGKNKLDNILKEYNYPKNFDFLSIDIDGNDYHIFQGLKVYRPKLILIEFNPTIPNEINFVQQKNVKINQGSSALALIKMAKKKGYSPIAATDFNLFFIKNSLKKYVVKKNYQINDLIDNKNKNYIFAGFDGSIITSRKISLPWHGMMIKKINFLPKVLEQYPGNYNIVQKIMLFFYRFYQLPFTYKNIKKIFNYTMKIIIK